MTATQGIPTKFNGTQFRSRLEARWAAFFERIEWPYIYEPFDADGYIPDFLINKPGYPPLLVEIKPIATHSEYIDELFRILPRLQGHWNGPVLVLGVAPYYRLPNKAPSAGLYYDEKIIRNIVRHEDRAEVIGRSIARGCWWVNPPDPDDPGGIYLKPSFLDTGIVSKRGAVTRSNLELAWRSVGNEVQWKSPGPKKPMSAAERTQDRIRRAQDKRPSR